LLIVLNSPLFAQGPKSRAEEWQNARREKAKNLAPEELSTVEARLNYIRDNRLIERVTQGVAGLRVKLGGLDTGQGFALGPEYLRREIARGRIHFRGSARGAMSGAYILDLQLTFPRLANDKASLDLSAVRKNSPRVDYYGPGPDSDRGSRTNYGIETSVYQVTAGLTPLPHLELGVTGGLLQVDTNRGNRSGVAQVEDIFTSDTTMGLSSQPDFLKGGFIAHFDSRDNPGGPRAGGSYLAKWITYDDRGLDRHDFHRLELEAQQYFPFFNKRRVVALRVRTLLSFTRRDQSVPFYLQPTLGGSDDLRGFRPYRFSDNHQIVANLEYRWETFSGLDAALFFDAGKVVAQRSQINFRDLEASGGFGLRFNIRNNIFLRLDVGVGREGPHVWLKFRGPF
jgi:outer membrane protein assembly factor BamA